MTSKQNQLESYLGRDYLKAMIEAAEPPHREATLADRRLIRRQYVDGLGSVKELAALHKLSFHTVLGWSRDDKWTALRSRREALEVAKLEQGLAPEQPLPEQPRNVASILQAHIDRIDDQLETAMDARDIANLVKARGDMAEQLHVALHGVKPGTAKTTGKQARRAPVQLAPTVADEGQGSDSNTQGQSPPAQ